MFCPNCGKDCGNANFCSHCGSKLADAAARPRAWSVGMPCPHCGGTKLEGNNCAFCGAQLMLDADTQADSGKDLFDIPYQTFSNNILDRVTLCQDAITLDVSFLFKRSRHRIPFERLKKVTLKIADSPDRVSATGFLTFCWEKDLNNPTTKRRHIPDDQESIWFPEPNRDLFFHLFWLLKYVIPAHVDFTCDIVCTKGDRLENKLGRKVKWDDYVQQFTPYRDPAISAVCREHGLMRVDVEDIVHYAFEMHLCEFYNANPSLAVRDVNLILQDKKRKKEEKEREREERRASRR